MLREIFYRQFADIRRDEWPRALLLSGFFFLVIATYWIVKPLKRGVIINYFGDQPLSLFGLTFAGAEAEQIGKVLNLVMVYFVVLLFTWLARKVPRHYLVATFAALFSAAFALFGALINQLSQPVVWSFYVFGDMFNTAMVGIFWAFTNDIVQADEAKRTYGIIGLGGVIGGFVGATFVNSSVENFGRAPLLFFCIVPMVLIAIIAFVVHHKASAQDGEDTSRPAASSRKGSSAIWEGAKLVFNSKYLLAIAGIICIYEMVSNIIDFQLAATVADQITQDLAKDKFFALIGQFISGASIFVQLFLTAFVMRKFGVRIALLFLPVAILLSATGFLALPILAFAGAMSVADNALNYSINQSAKESLYTPTSQNVTYKAKAFIDMFVQRFAKVISVVLNLAMAAVFVEGVRWLSIVTLAMISGWFLLIRVASRGFAHRMRRESNGDDGEMDADVRALEEELQSDER